MAAEQAGDHRQQFKMGNRLFRVLCCARFPSSFLLTAVVVFSVSGLEYSWKCYIALSAPFTGEPGFSSMFGLSPEQAK